MVVQFHCQLEMSNWHLYLEHLTPVYLRFGRIEKLIFIYLPPLTVKINVFHIQTSLFSSFITAINKIEFGIEHHTFCPIFKYFWNLMLKPNIDQLFTVQWMDSHSKPLFYIAERRIRSVINEFPVSYYSLGNISIHKARRISSIQSSLAQTGDQWVTIYLILLLSHDFITDTKLFDLKSIHIKTKKI